LFNLDHLKMRRCDRHSVASMAKEYFFAPETKPLFAQLDELTRRSGVSRGQAFEDFLTAMVCALAAETKEDEYLAMAERHKKGPKGKRGIDLLTEMFARLIVAMDKSDADILGDLFQGSITYGEAGQYFTPETIAGLLAGLTVGQADKVSERKPFLISDPCCGTGRLLLEVAKRNPGAELVGQDVDARCAKAAAISLGLRGRYGWVLCGNSLTQQVQFAYRIGSFFHETNAGLRRGVIRDVPVEQLPAAACQGLFAKHEQADETTPRLLAGITEVPRWLARLEAIRRTPDREVPVETESLPVPKLAEAEDQWPHTKPPSGTQRELF